MRSLGVVGVKDASNFVALVLYALQHRGQEAGGIVSHDANLGFNSARDLATSEIILPPSLL